MKEDIKNYNSSLQAHEVEICNTLADIIDNGLRQAESKIWHAHPVWFIDQNPIVGYSRQKKGIRLMFWSGADFGVEGLPVKGKNFKDASIFYNDINEIDINKLKIWLKLAETIQWDYRNLIKRKGRLERLEIAEKNTL